MARRLRDDDEPATTDETIVREAQARYRACDEYEREWRDAARADLLFEAGDSRNNNQWPTEILNGRTGSAVRPTLTINKVQLQVKMILNDAAQNAMSIKVNAVGLGSTPDAADAIEGIIRHIETQSNAQQNAYKLATSHQVRAGKGYVHLETDYAPGMTFDQELWLRAVPDPFSVWLDHTCREPDKSDARWGLIGIDMPREQYRAEYPDHADLDGVLSFTGAESGGALERDWRDRDTVRVMRYYRKRPTRDRIIAIPGAWLGGPPNSPSRVVTVSGMQESALEIARQAKFPERDMESAEVEWFLIAGTEIIDRGDSVFPVIPLVPMIGEEVLIDGRADWKGHVRHLVDAQRMYNYNASRAVEFVGLQSRAPYMGDARSFEGHENAWGAMNSPNPPPYLPVNGLDSDSGASLPLPERQDPPQADSAAIQGMQIAEQQMQMVSGQYEAQEGAPGNERSGVAIQQRQRQSGTATYHFTDGQGAALRLIGHALLGALPRVYDSQRALQIVNPDGSREGVVIDPQLRGGPGGMPIAHQRVQPPMVPAQGNMGAAPTSGAPPAAAAGGLVPAPSQPMQDPADPASSAKAILAINPNVGRYAVEPDVGPGYATRRQDAWNALLQICTQAPQMVTLIGDLLMQVADFPMHDEVAERLRRMVPPQALGEDDPQVAALQHQLQQMSAAMQAQGQAMEGLKDRAALDQQKLMLAVREAVTSQYKAETERLASLGDIDPAALIPVVRETIRQTMKDMGIDQPVRLAHPHDPSMDGPPPGTTMDGSGNLRPVPRLPNTNAPGGPVRSPESVGGNA